MAFPALSAQGDGPSRRDGEAGGETMVVVTAAGLAERSGVAAFRRAARATNTLAAYRADWNRFERWCHHHHLRPLPADPGVVATYLADAATATNPAGRSAPWAYSPNTIARWLATINKAHDLAGQVAPGKAPDVADTLAGIRRARATPAKRKTPLLLADLETMVAGINVTGWPAAPGGIRNRALLVMGWVGAFRRAELAELTIADVNPHPDDGLHVTVRVSKTDPGAAGRTYGLPYARRPLLCAPCAWARWRAIVDAWDGTSDGPAGRAGVMRATTTFDVDGHICRDPAHHRPRRPAGDQPVALFRSVRANGTIGGPIGGYAIDAVIKQAAATAGFDPETIGGHSLRAGFVTQAFRSGADAHAHAIMRQTGHRDPKTLEIYARETAPLVGNAVTQLGL